MSKEYKPISQLDKALAFILDNFTDGDGEFDCPCDDEYCPDDAFECSECRVKKDYNEIMGK